MRDGGRDEDDVRAAAGGDEPPAGERESGDPREMDRAHEDEARHLRPGEVPDDEVHEEMVTDHDR